MKLIIAIVSDDLIREVTDHLMDKNIRSTKLASSGGFLKKRQLNNPNRFRG